MSTHGPDSSASAARWLAELLRARGMIPGVSPGGHSAHIRNITRPGNLTGTQLSYKMLYMRKATNISIRELQQNLKRVIARVERGQVVEVTRHRRPVARLEPMSPTGVVAPWPDLGARARAVFGDRLVMPSPSEIVIEDRGER